MYNSEPVYSDRVYPATPISQRTQALTWYRFRLIPFRSPLLRESLRFLFLALLRCFSSRRSPSYPMNSDKNDLGLPSRVTPFRNLRINAWLTAPRSLWQSSTSFNVSWYQRHPPKSPFQLITNLYWLPCYSNIIWILTCKYFKDHKKFFITTIFFIPIRERLY